jgi:hypothetical protein
VIIYPDADIAQAALPQSLTTQVKLALQPPGYTCTTPSSTPSSWPINSSSTLKLTRSATPQMDQRLMDLRLIASNTRRSRSTWRWERRVRSRVWWECRWMRGLLHCLKLKMKEHDYDSSSLPSGSSALISSGSWLSRHRNTDHLIEYLQTLLFWLRFAT